MMKSREMSAKASSCVGSLCRPKVGKRSVFVTRSLPIEEIAGKLGVFPTLSAEELLSEALQSRWRCMSKLEWP